MLYKDWLCEWLSNYMRHLVKPKTYDRYADIVANRLTPKLGDYEMADITPLIVQKYAMELLQSGNMSTGGCLAVSSVNLVISVIQSSFRAACAFGMIRENGMSKIKRPKKYEKQTECFSTSEQKKIEQAVLHDKRDKMIGVLLCLYTGWRIGELLSLEWTDFTSKHAN